MHYITLISLYLALKDLLTKRLTALQSFSAGAAQVQFLTMMRDDIAALPAVVEGRPLVEELDAADERHDALGYAGWHFVEAYLQHPDTPPAVLAAAKQIRAAFLPTIEDLVASYPAEAKAAMERKPDLVSLKPQLDLFPVATDKPGVYATLHSWVSAFLQAGENIDTLLSARADIDAKGRKEASRLRAEAIGMLNRLRKSLAFEMKRNPNLPADLDAQVFGYFDQQEQAAAAANAQSKAQSKAKGKGVAASGSASGSAGAAGGAAANAGAPQGDGGAVQ